MKHNIWTTTFAAVVGVATATVLGAQTPTTAQQQQTPTTSTAPSAEKTVTIVGCLRPASGSADTTQSAAGTAGTAGTATGTTAGSTTGTTGTSGTAATAGTTGTAAGTTAQSSPAAAADAANQKFILTEAGPSAAEAGTTSTAGATTQATTAGSAQRETYRLIANGSALSPHVGKKLELTGTLEANSASATDTTSGPDAGRPTLRVQSGRIIAASCDAK